MKTKKSSTVNLLASEAGTRFAIPAWFDLEALRILMAGIESESEPDSGEDGESE